MCFGCRLFHIRRTHFGCRIFDIRRTADRMSKIRHLKKGASDVEYTTFDGRLIKCRIFDIRNTLLWMSNIRHSTEANIGSEIESFCTPLLDNRTLTSANWKFLLPKTGPLLLLTCCPTPRLYFS